MIGHRSGGDRMLLDTFFVRALLNARDARHQDASALMPRIIAASEVVVTEAVLTEIGNALSESDREQAARYIRRCYTTSNVTVVSVDGALFQRALALYEQRPDKARGLTDCISFVVMTERGNVDAAMGDRHFHQAGFRPLLAA